MFILRPFNNDDIIRSNPPLYFFKASFDDRKKNTRNKKRGDQRNLRRSTTKPVLDNLAFDFGSTPNDTHEGNRLLIYLIRNSNKSKNTSARMTLEQNDGVRHVM